MKVFILGFLALVTTPANPYTYEARATIETDSIKVSVEVHPDGGWKWNEEYPSTIKIKYKDGTTGRKYTLNSGKIVMTVAPRQESLEGLTAVLTFGLCTKRTCRVFRNQQFKVSFG